MNKFRSAVLMAISLVIVVALAGCTAAAVEVPSRPIKISQESGYDAQNSALSGMLTGNIELTEEQFSSLLSELLKTNSGPNFPISEIQAWFEPNDEIILRAVLKPNVLLSGDTLDLKGTVGVMDNHVTLNLQQAGMGSLSVGEPLMSMISQQINSVLAGPQFSVAASVKTDTGKLMVQIGQ